MIVKDSMVLIHLAKITLLEKSCNYFGTVLIPGAVFSEILEGREKGHGDVKVINDLVEAKKIMVKKITKKAFIQRAREFNITKGEGEAVALYWQEKADFLLTDDDEVRRKRMLLGIKVIGTPAVILELYQKRIIGRGKFEESTGELRKIGWFSNQVIDKILLEAEKWERQ